MGRPCLRTHRAKGQAAVLERERPHLSWLHCCGWLLWQWDSQGLWVVVPQIPFTLVLPCFLCREPAGLLMTLSGSAGTERSG